MEPLINVEPIPDHAGDVCAAINNSRKRIYEQIAGELTERIKDIKLNGNMTAAEFWERVGTQGTTVLTELATWRGMLQTGAPELINDIIQGAGSDLVPHKDGTVTVG